MKKAKIFYFTLQDEQTKEEKLEWFERTRFEDIPFDHITPDQKANWINLTDNDFDELLPLIDKQVKSGKSEEAIFQLFSSGVKTQRDEWVYDFSKDALIERMKYFVEVYQSNLGNSTKEKLDIKWDDDLVKYLKRGIKIYFDCSCIVRSQYRPFSKRFIYFNKYLNARTYQWFDIFHVEKFNISIAINVGNPDFACLGSDLIFDLASLKFGNGTTQCLPLYRYDKNSNRIDNITDWGLNQIQTHYNDPTITKENIFHYTYAILHHPTYRTKYELNLKREFPRLPLYPNFHQWTTWGQTLMELHLNYETTQPHPLPQIQTATKPNPKPKLKADKTTHIITIDENTQLHNIPPLAWAYKLGNRSALEWILDQYKEKKPKDPTIAQLFNTYKFSDYKTQVIDLLQRVCTVSLRTMEIIQTMPTE
ncbi:type ISP restriction/modification enzyme [Spirulina sp. CCNP1310]|nr:type ISP restriction/modification enzyme [Spirulina sp. CCNP1310]